MTSLRHSKISAVETVHRCFGLILLCVFLPHCSAPVSVKTVKPPAPVESTHATSKKISVRMMAVHSSYQKLGKKNKNTLARYNFELARLMETIELNHLDPWSDDIQISTPKGIYTLKGKLPKGLSIQHGKLIPTDTLSFHGDYAKNTCTVSGVGTPLLLVKNLEHLGHEEVRNYRPIQSLTAVIKFTGKVATLQLIDPYQHEQVSIQRENHTLSANFSAATMFALSKSRIDKLGFSRLLKPSKYKNTAHLNFLQPYDANRIPVLLVHGLDSSPATYAPMLFGLLDDPEIRKHFQFWVFSYPSGYPYPYSAMLLRKELDKVKKDYPHTQDLVIIGHSMGSMVSRIMVTDAGDKLWKTAFGTSVEQTKIRGKSRDILTDCLVFESRPEIDRAIFICGPHRGSKLASQYVRRLSSKLIKLPGFMADVRDQMVSVSTLDTAAIHISKAPTSIDTLSPNNPFILAINKIPISPDVTYHSIIGDRGKGDTPNSSDGVVEYWSSHLEGAKSEKIVPRNHSAHQHQEAIQEVQRILHSHYKTLK